MSQDVTNSEKELSEKQVLAIPHLVSAKSVSETAELVGVTRRTVYRWMDDPTFREEYDRQRDAVASFARSGMRALMLKALVIQAERFDSNNARESARAAKVIMDYDAKPAPNTRAKSSSTSCTASSTVLTTGYWTNPRSIPSSNNTCIPMSANDPAF